MVKREPPVSMRDGGLMCTVAVTASELKEVDCLYAKLATDDEKGRLIAPSTARRDDLSREGRQLVPLEFSRDSTPRVVGMGYHGPADCGADTKLPGRTEELGGAYIAPAWRGALCETVLNPRTGRPLSLARVMTVLRATSALIELDLGDVEDMTLPARVVYGTLPGALASRRVRDDLGFQAAPNDPVIDELFAQRSAALGSSEFELFVLTRRDAVRAIFAMAYAVLSQPQLLVRASDDLAMPFFVDADRFMIERSKLLSMFRTWGGDFVERCAPRPG